MNKSAGKSLDYLKVVRMVFWSGVVGPGTKLSLVRSRFALGARRSYDRATRSKARLVSKSSKTLDDHFASYENIAWI